MSFVRIARHHSKAMVDSVSIALAQPASTRTLSLRVRFGFEVAKEAGFSLGTKTELLWGKGPDAGKFLCCRVGNDAAPGNGIALRHSGGKKGEHGGSLDGFFGHLPRRPFSGPGGRMWHLIERGQPVVRARWEVSTDGLVITTPAEWWDVKLPGGELLGRVMSMLEKGADEAAIIRATRIAPGDLQTIRSALVAEQRERISNMTTVGRG